MLTPTQFNNLGEILKRRGYVIDVPLNMHSHGMVFMSSCSTVHRMLLYISDLTVKVGVNQVRDVLKLMDQERAADCVLVCTKVTPSASAALKELKREQITLVFPRQLLFNIFNHEHVPEHTLLTMEESRRFLETKKLSVSQMPGISVDDVVIRLLGGRIGQVVRITRNRPNIGYHDYYRVVVNLSE